MGRVFFAKSFAVFGAVTAGFAVLFSFIVTSDEARVGLAVSVVWMALNFPGQLVSMIFSESIHNTTGPWFYLGVAVQWFIIGYFVRRFFHNRKFPDAPPPPPDQEQGAPG